MALYFCASTHTFSSPQVSSGLSKSKTRGILERTRSPYSLTKQNAFNLPGIRKCTSHDTTPFIKSYVIIDPPSAADPPAVDPSIVVTPTTLKRKDFPPDFIFGATTSAIQTEGPGYYGGRTPSTWDPLIRAHEGEKAVDSYYLYHEDVKLLKDMGAEGYRFSIAWPRILPDGTTNHVNQEGVDFYNKLLDELEKHDIKPIVTLFHFDLPIELQKKYGGFMDRRIIDDFRAYCDFCFKTFGKRVKHWITINEAVTFVLYGAKLGLNGEAAKDPMSPYILTHNLLLAHAAAATLYKEHYQATQGGEIGMSVVCKWSEPHSPNPADIAAAENCFDRFTGWYLGPLCNGDYPDALKDFVVGLPEFSTEEKKSLKGSCDFIGVNYYITSYAKAKTVCTVTLDSGHTRHDSIEELYSKDGTYIGPFAEGTYPLYIYPEGLKKMLVYMKNKYKNPTMIITENGIPSKANITLSVKDAEAMGLKYESGIENELHDQSRIFALRNHIFAIHEAMKEKVNVKGYFSWTLMDNMEFGVYDVRFGLNYTDYLDNFKRYPKDSARWYGDFLHGK